MEFIASFDEYDLLIIEDLDVERSTEYAMEQLFFVIDSRYRSRRHMIITANLKLYELKNLHDLAHVRTYDCILERCALILFDGKTSGRKTLGSPNRQRRTLLTVRTTDFWPDDAAPPGKRSAVSEEPSIM